MQQCTGNVLVPVRNPHRLKHLKRVIEKTNTDQLDIVVVSISDEDSEFTHRESELFTNCVQLAEKAGKTVKLLTVPGKDPIASIVETAARLESSRIVVGSSPRLSPSQQGHSVGVHWELLPEPRPAISLEIVPDDPEAKPHFVNLGPHPPRLWPEDIERVHQLWLDLQKGGLGHQLHHRDVVGLALKRLEADAKGKARGEILHALRKE